MLGHYTHPVPAIISDSPDALADALALALADAEPGRAGRWTQETVVVDVSLGTHWCEYTTAHVEVPA